ncbi:hypothetical protein [Nodosilinea sp. P-1105]|uniref:hypothetical protein n=1 Tax=Nodosilinea sp. P-1105 TaxID=2546229 RepID=UPI00146A17AD|nr:hypothetical protein [Nodosilinea sp. P-1105]NMF83536.1 hypothetical protein [Nodosilinea sp. P-1105]
MTDTIAANPGPDPQDQNLSEAQTVPETKARMSPEAGNTPPANDWEPVILPGQITLDDQSPDESSEVTSAGLSPANSCPEAGSEETDSQGNQFLSDDTNELVQLIQDLNQCNDALLLRVSDLEEALERSQVALQAEIERNQSQAAPAVPPAPSQAGPVAQQIAQLLSELDIANDGLRRTTIHNEALQAELEVNQQRVAQLERDCTLLQQRFNDKANALQQAETSCRDLKSRLHRQQHYTLQFKAALEKCLSMTGDREGGVAPSPSPEHDAAEAQPVAMPKIQQIRPWSANQTVAADAPALTDLLRGLKGAQPQAAETAQAPAPEPLPSPSHTDPPAPEVSFWSSPDPSAESAARPSTPQTDPWFEAPTSGSDAAPQTPAAASTEASSPEFTEPSPWGEPLATPAPEPVPPVAEVAPTPPFAASPSATPAPATPLETAPSPIPAMASAAHRPSPGASRSPSPLVYPLRSQKKIKSIAAVELPSFGRNPRHR